MKQLLSYLVLVIPVSAGFCLSFAQTSEDLAIEIVPQDGNYLYRTGETAVLNINVLTPGAVSDATGINYRLSLNGATILKEGRLDLDEGKGRIKATLERPGFLRCDVSCIVGKDTLYAACGCGFSVEEIRPAGILPENFDRFWREAKAELLRIPIDAKLEEVEVVDPGDAKRLNGYWKKYGKRNGLNIKCQNSPKVPHYHIGTVLLGIISLPFTGTIPTHFPGH